jgi:hypothetical protein
LRLPSSAISALLQSSVVPENRFTGVLHLLAALCYCGYSNAVTKDQGCIRDQQDVLVLSVHLKM